MTLDSLIMLSGAFVAILPFLGFPQSWDSVFFFLAGILIVALGIVVRRKRGEWETEMRKHPHTPAPTEPPPIHSGERNEKPPVSSGTLMER